jgi:phosphoglycerate kinase
MKLPPLKSANLKDKAVILRVDFNVPMEDEKILDDSRIKAALPTIEYILNQGAKKLILISHFGRPDGKVVEELKLAPIAEYLAPFLGNHHFQLLDEPMTGTYFLKPNTYLLENIRFYPQEEVNDPEFAKKLASFGDIFVNDALSVCHRANASVVGIAQNLPSYAGLNLEKEVEVLSSIIEDPAKPFVVIIGGVKMEEKGPAVENLAKIADKVLVGGKVGLQLLNSQFNIQDSNIMLPLDDVDGLDIGPKTVEAFIAEIKGAKSLFWNGNLGKSEEEKYSQGTKKVLAAVVQSSAQLKVAAGGDTLAFINQENCADKFNFLSLGGGATLEFLSGEKLPGLEVLRN